MQKHDEGETSKKKTPVKRGKAARKKQDGKSFETAFEVFPEGDKEDVGTSKKRKSSTGVMGGKKKQKVESSDNSEERVPLRRGRSASRVLFNPYIALDRKKSVESDVKTPRQKASAVRTGGRVIPSKEVKRVTTDTDLHKEVDVVASPSKRCWLGSDSCDLLEDDVPLNIVFQRRYKMKKTGGVSSWRPLYDSNVDKSFIIPPVPIVDTECAHVVKPVDIHVAVSTSGCEVSVGDDKGEDFTADTHTSKSCGEVPVCDDKVDVLHYDTHSPKSDKLCASQTARLYVLADLADGIDCGDTVEGVDTPSADSDGEGDVPAPSVQKSPLGVL